MPFVLKPPPSETLPRDHDARAHSLGALSPNRRPVTAVIAGYEAEERADAPVTLRSGVTVQLGAGGRHEHRTMTVTYAVTFEFAMRAPLTHRGTIAGGRAATCVARAVREAQAALRPRVWSSLVCVLLERLSDATEPADVCRVEQPEQADDAEEGL